MYKGPQECDGKDHVKVADDGLDASSTAYADDCSSNTTVGRFQCIQKYFALLQTYFTDGKGSLQDGTARHDGSLSCAFLFESQRLEQDLSFQQAVMRRCK